MKAVELGIASERDGKIVVPEAFKDILAKKSVEIIHLYEEQEE